MKLKKTPLLLSITSIFMVTTSAYANNYVKVVSSDCDFCYKNQTNISIPINNFKNQNSLGITYKTYDRVELDDADTPKVKKNLFENIYQTTQWILDPKKNEAPVFIQTVQWIFDPNKKELLKPKKNQVAFNTPIKKKKDTQGFKFAILKNTYLKASLSNPSSDIDQDSLLKNTKTTKQPKTIDTNNNKLYKILDITSENPSTLLKKIIPSMQVGIEVDF